MHRVLVLGATGHFGGRICRALRKEPSVELLLAARQRAALEAMARALELRDDRIVTPSLEEAPLAASLRVHRIDTVIHTVGPFQGQDYAIARAAIAAGVHYIDLADGRDFVAGFAGALDAPARAADALAVSGASTLPALSSAVIDELQLEFDALERIDIVIAPAQRTPRGPATVGAVLSYCGRPFSWLEDGQWRTVHGWQSLRRIELPGLGRRVAAACDVPDLALLPRRYPGLRTVQFRAALELSVQHLGLWALAALRRRVPALPITRLVPLVAAAGRALDRFGSERGGMSIRMCGTHDKRPVERIWHIVAEENQGPELPCLAAEILALRLADGTESRRGAMPCVGLLTLADFERAFAAWPFRWGVVAA